MKSLIVTVAGTATRFNRDTKRETLKCIYHEGNPRECLLARILDKSRNLDELIVVGGYLFDELYSFINLHLSEYKEKIKLVYNPEYKTYGSGYSLILGIGATSPESDEIVFVEGDLNFDRDDYSKVIESNTNVLTVNHELITARKAVVVYENCDGRLRYLYDTAHNALEIKEPFLAIYNSGQIWKFMDTRRVREIVGQLSEQQIKGTNLEIIQAYFGELGKNEYEIIPFSQWYNCNTVADYRQSIIDLKA